MQVEHHGRGQLRSITHELQKLKAKSVFLVTGNASYVQSGGKAKLSSLLSDFDVTEFNQFSPNPTFLETMAGVALFRTKKIDVIIAIGGGSCIDIAKSINALSAHPGAEQELVEGTQQLSQPLLPFIAIPTTSGTGSEATHFSVIYLEGKKYSLADQNLLPNVSIIDSSLTDKLPAYVTASSGFDALCQAIESYWSKNASPQSQQYSSAAIELILDWLPLALETGSKDARDNLIIAANLSGKAINLTKTTAPHALSYSITSNHGLAHGHAVALTLGAFFPLHNQLISNKEKNKDSLAIIMKGLYQLLRVETEDQAIIQWYQLMHRCGLETNLVKLGIDDKSIHQIVAEVNLERLNNHPINLSTEMLESLFTQILTSN